MLANSSRGRRGATTALAIPCVKLRLDGISKRFIARRRHELRYHPEDASEPMHDHRNQDHVLEEGDGRGGERNRILPPGENARRSKDAGELCACTNVGMAPGEKLSWATPYSAL